MPDLRQREAENIRPKLPHSNHIQRGRGCCTNISSDRTFPPTPVGAHAGWVSVCYKENDELRSGCFINGFTPPNIVAVGDKIHISKTLCEKDLSKYNLCTGEVSTSESDTEIEEGEFIDIEKEAENADTSRSLTDNSIYHPKFNFFSYEKIDSREPKSLVNTSFLNIFKGEIPDTLKYILDRIGTNDSWSEFVLTQIDSTEFETALTPVLRGAFELLKTNRGYSINSSEFYETVWWHMIHETLDRVDERFFLDTAKNQSSDKFLNFEKSIDSSVNERAALGILETEAFSADPVARGAYHASELERTHVLLPDLEATLPIVDQEGNTISLEIGNAAGIEVTLVDSATDFLFIGEGSGYYLTLVLGDNTQTALPLTTAISESFYIPADTREHILDLFGADSNIFFTAQSLPGQTEFHYETYSVTGFTAPPLYFSVDLTSITETSYASPLVEEISVNYNLISDIDDINTHAKSFGADGVSVNINYDDPAYVYAKDSGSLTLELNNITFRNFTPGRSTYMDQILIRSLPMFVVLNPGCGTRHNPYGQWSELGSVPLDLAATGTASRHFSIAGDFSKTRDEAYIPILEEKNVKDTVGVDYIGLVEAKTPNANRIFYQFSTDNINFQNTYFYNGAYTSTPPTSRQLPITGRLVQIIKTLKDRYNLNNDKLTFWDIFRRLTLSEFMQIFYHTPASVLHSIENGLVDGTKVRHVLGRETGGETGLLSVKDENATEATIILNESDREYRNKILVN